MGHRNYKERIEESKESEEEVMEFKDGLNAIAKMCREQRADNNKGCRVCPLLDEDGDCLLYDCCPEDYDADKVAEALESAKAALEGMLK